MNKEERKEYNKQYRESHRDKVKEYRESHRDKAKEYAKEYRESQPGYGSSKTNKKSSSYLGVTVAEKVLSRVFKNVEVMPPNNSGYDFICNSGYMIDVKSACKSKNQNNWMFNINRNQIADYFLILAFDNRENLNPKHIWLISGKIVNHLKSLVVSVATVDKWSEYELTNKLNDVISCCDILRGD